MGKSRLHARARSRTRWWRWLLLIFVGLLALVLLGPRVSPLPLHAWPLPKVPGDPLTLQRWIDQREQAVVGLRPDNQARIVWVDPAHPARTQCAMIYLHGFTASQGEGAPTHERLARELGCNLYLPRLPGHGLVADDALRGVDAEALMKAATEALAVGQALGDRVVVIGTSMGGALATRLVASHPEHVRALVLWSPLVRERDDALELMRYPWGAQAMAWLRNGGDPVMHWKSDSQYWASGAHVDGYRTLVALTRGGMVPSTFAKIEVPVFLGYYFRDQEHQDPSVSVPAMRAMLGQLGTPIDKREAVDFPDAGAHVIASPLRSKVAPEVFEATCRFLRQKAGMALAPGRSGCGQAWAADQGQKPAQVSLEGKLSAARPRAGDAASVPATQ